MELSATQTRLFVQKLYLFDENLLVSGFLCCANKCLYTSKSFLKPLKGPQNIPKRFQKLQTVGDHSDACRTLSEFFHSVEIIKLKKMYVYISWYLHIVEKNHKLYQSQWKTKSQSDLSQCRETSVIQNSPEEFQSSNIEFFFFKIASRSKEIWMIPKYFVRSFVASVWQSLWKPNKSPRISFSRQRIPDMLSTVVPILH